MNNKFAKRLEEYLSSELCDYDLEYSWEWSEDTNNCIVTVIRNTNPLRKSTINFRYDENVNELKIELCEDSFYTTREYDNTVKYLWMRVASELFSDK